MAFGWVTLLLVLGSLACWTTSAQDATPAAVGRITEQEAVDALNAFSSKVLRLASRRQENVLISPVSLITMLDMLTLGSRNQTDALVNKVLSLESAPDPGQGLQLLRDLIGTMVSNHSSFELMNEALLQRRPSTAADRFDKYKADVEQTLGGKVLEVDFAHDGSAIKDRINNEVSLATHERIPTLLSDELPPDTGFTLLNAAHFQQEWHVPFQLDSRSKYNRQGSPSGSEKGELMVRQRTYIAAVSNRVGDVWVNCMQLEYQDGKTAMVIILPDNSRDLDEMLASPSFDADLATVFKSLRDTEMRKRYVTVLLPKFKLDSHCDLKQLLSDLGMGSLFTAATDLSGMTGDQNVLLSTANHKAFISIDDRGTEVSDVNTLSNITLESGFTFQTDPPFVFVIHDTETGLILFTGRVAPLPA